MSDEQAPEGKSAREWLRHLEPFMIVVGFVGPFSTLPQLSKLYLTHSDHAAGFSLITWTLYAALSTLWFIYGLYIKKPAIYMSNGLSGIMNYAMAIGIIIHAGLTY
jgi:MtN3 and saliva related transmembrane protein